MNVSLFQVTHAYQTVQDMLGADGMNYLELNQSFPKEMLRCGLELLMVMQEDLLLS